METFYSNGKLLLTGEYVILDGANALAIPTKYGQTLTIESINKPEIQWTSVNNEGLVWFHDTFTILNNTFQSIKDDTISKRLIQILNAAKQINPSFLSNTLKTNTGFKVTSKLDFPNNWGLGSSSSLLNNIAQWAKIDAFKLSNATFGGSGYDIACAQNNSPILYALKKYTPTITPLAFNPSFKSQLFFVHLNQKQDSRASIKKYQENKGAILETISEINTITSTVVKTNSITAFENLIIKHEILIGKITNQVPVKDRLFSDYKHAIKSLGGWGGDFILVTGKEDYVKSYFKEKGFETILPYFDMSL